MFDRLRLKLVRWAFARFYSEGAWTYDAVAALISRGYWARWIQAVRPYLHGRVLELGCGTGYLQAALASDRQRYHVGLDLSRQMLQLTRRRTARAGQEGLLVRARAQQLPFHSASFDSIVATFPAEYIVDSATLEEVRRALGPGGRLLILDAGQLPPGFSRRLVNLVYALVFGRRAALPASLPTPDPRFELLHSAGFRVDERWERVRESRVQVLVAEVSSCRRVTKS
ncbi:MAG: type 11 methyltransferase [Herpetosiphonaceae bacterium]|nr:MAG: type 11 methyltransferase [Herpetosiphonaceae bacterium]